MQVKNVTWHLAFRRSASFSPNKPLKFERTRPIINKNPYVQYISVPRLQIRKISTDPESPGQALQYCFSDHWYFCKHWSLHIPYSHVPCGEQARPGRVSIRSGRKVLAVRAERGSLLFSDWLTGQTSK